ncbi:hypothetical protein GQR58_014072 [Nymphon striatum]|nr:hypothetical protein GQR58_014072 [Nymphon striatum]
MRDVLCNYVMITNGICSNFKKHGSVHLWGMCAIQISLNRKSLVDAKIPRSRQVLTLAAQSKESVTKIEPLYAVDSTVLFMRISVLLERSGNEIENYFRYELMPEPTSFLWDIAVCGANVIVVSNETDVKIMLLYLYNSEMGDIIAKPFG